MDSVGEGEGGKIWENGIETCEISCMKRDASPGSMHNTGWVIGVDYCDIEWFALETNGDHSVVFEVTPKYCILDSFVDFEGYFISPKGFFPTVVDIMVI